MADHDIAAFQALMQHTEVHPAMACFHAQQAVEKCVKAVLFSRTVEFRRTHDLTGPRALDTAALADVIDTVRAWAGEIVG